MDVGTSGTRLFDIRGDGLTTVSSGGMAVLSGGATVTGGLTVRRSSTAARFSSSAVTVDTGAPVVPPTGT